MSAAKRVIYSAEEASHSKTLNPTHTHQLPQAGQPAELVQRVRADRRAWVGH